MAKKKKKTIYKSIRKPLAKPTVRFKNKKKVEKADKVGRKRKHKKEDGNK